MACVLGLLDRLVPASQILVGILLKNLDAFVWPNLGRKAHKLHKIVMKRKVGFKLRSICGEHVIVAEGKENIDFSKIISMNETSAYLWEAVEDIDFTVESLADLLTEQYIVDYEVALRDCKELVEKWLEAGIIEP